MKLITLGFAILLLSASAEAEDAIQTDRPDFVESSNTVGHGVFQLEMGLSHDRTRLDGATETAWSTPTLLRYGIAETWELRLETPGHQSLSIDDPANPPSTTERGMADYSLGLKWHQRDGDETAGTASVAWLFHADMPGGTGSFRSRKVRPSVRAVAEWALADDYALGVMPGLVYGADDTDRRYWGGIFAVVLGKGFGERLRGFVELSGQELRSTDHGGPVVTFDIGAAWLAGKDIQLDAIYSRGLNRHTPDHSVGLGLSLRF